MRRGGRAWFKAHAWNACKLERVSGVRIPPSPPNSLKVLPPFWRWREIRAERGAFRSKGTRESKLRPEAPDLGGVLSARRKVGSLQDPEAFRLAFAHSSPLSKWR